MFVCMYVDVHAIGQVWKWENHFVEPVLSFPLYMGCRD